MKPAGLLLFSFLLISAPAQAQDKRSWMFMKNGTEASLTYGTPESDDGIVSFRCNTLTGEALIDVPETNDKVKPNQKAELVLEIGETSARYQGETFPNDMAGVPGLQAATTMKDPIFASLANALLANGAVLKINAAGQLSEAPLNGIGKKILSFRAACKSK